MHISICSQVAVCRPVLLILKLNENTHFACQIACNNGVTLIDKVILCFS